LPLSLGVSKVSLYGRLSSGGVRAGITRIRRVVYSLRAAPATGITLKNMYEKRMQLSSRRHCGLLRTSVDPAEFMCPETPAVVKAAGLVGVRLATLCMRQVRYKNRRLQKRKRLFYLPLSIFLISFFAYALV